MKKKYSVTSKDIKDWEDFIQETKHLYDKDKNISETNNEKKIRKLDLHGFSISEANKTVKKFIIESHEIGYKKLLIITGKGTRSKVSSNPYISERLNILKNSVPEFIKSNEILSHKIKQISKADQKDGGDGAFYILLKKNK